MHCINGNLKADISIATNNKGQRIYSIRFGRKMDEVGEKVSGFFRPHDLEKMKHLITEAQQWIDVDREEIRQSRSKLAPNQRRKK